MVKKTTKHKCKKCSKNDSIFKDTEYEIPKIPSDYKPSMKGYTPSDAFKKYSSRTASSKYTVASPLATVLNIKKKKR